MRKKRGEYRTRGENRAYPLTLWKQCLIKKTGNS